MNKPNIPVPPRPTTEAASPPSRVRQLEETESELIAALFDEGVKLHQMGRLADAETIYNQILAVRPEHPDCLHFLGVIFYQRGDYAEAVRLIVPALRQKPDDALALHNLGSALAMQGRRAEALASFSHAIAARPDYPDAYVHRGNVLRELGRNKEAIESYDDALVLRQDLAEAHCGRGHALTGLRRFDDAIQSHGRALGLQPNLAEAHCGRGVAYAETGLIEEALADFERAQKLRPNYAEAYVNEAMYRLVLGDFERGFEKYEWRWATSQLRGHKRDFAQPQWRGAEDIRGKTILLHAEQGLGDTIQFARYVPALAARGARVILEVQGPLQALITTVPGGAQVIAAGDPLPNFDVHCPLLSVPLAFGTRLDTIPHDVPYLSAPAEKVTAWRTRLGERTRPRIGLVWAGNPRKELPNVNRIDGERSMAVDQLAPLFDVEACSFYSLQKGDDAVKQLREGAWRSRVIDFTDDLRDFSDTAALIENLDLVIAVDTSVLHLAGALGRPVWLMNRFNTCWRWLRGRDDSPWYPSLRQFRQDAAKNWDPVVRRVARALRHYAQTASLGGPITPSS
jgi:Flp pilus assembly protein TadD